MENVTPNVTPRAPAALLASAAVLNFRATARDRSGSALGVLVNTSGVPQHLAISADGAWTLSSAPPAGRRTALLYESAANVLRGGAPNPDGSISYYGASYAIESSFDGEAWIARVKGCT